MNNIDSRYVKTYREMLLKASKTLSRKKGAISLDVRDSFLKAILFDYDEEKKCYEFVKDLEDIYYIISFSDINFEKVNLMGVDLTGFRGVRINPQVIYNKSLNGTICNGVRFIGIFNDVDIRNANFANSSGAHIDPQTIMGKDLTNTICSHSIFIGSFDDVITEGTDFSVSAQIDPVQMTIKKPHRKKEKTIIPPYIGALTDFKKKKKNKVKYITPSRSRCARQKSEDIIDSIEDSEEVFDMNNAIHYEDLNRIRLMKK